MTVWSELGTGNFDVKYIKTGNVKLKETEMDHGKNLIYLHQQQLKKYILQLKTFNNHKILHI